MNQNNDTSDTNSAHKLLRQGLQAMEDRAASRDNPNERSMARTVAAFNALTGQDLTEEEGWAFMVCLKEARALGGSKKVEDDYIDGAAYFALQGECAMQKQRLSTFVDEVPGPPEELAKALDNLLQSGAFATMSAMSGMPSISVHEETDEVSPPYYMKREQEDPPFTAELLAELDFPTKGKAFAMFCEKGPWIKGNFFTGRRGTLRFRPYNEEASYPVWELWAIGYD